MKLHELYAQVTNAIIKDLERGVATWVKPWKSGAKGGIMPYNAVSRRQGKTHGRHPQGVSALSLHGPAGAGCCAPRANAH